MGLISIDTKGLNQGKRQLLNVFLSGSCALCDRPAPAALCSSCQRQVQQTQLPNSLYQGQAGLPVISWGSYEGALKQSIARLKYDHRRDVAEFLGTELARTWLAVSCLNPSPRHRSPVIVPIPLHADRQQQRGFNQAELLGQWFCRVTRLPLQGKLLQRIQLTEAQHSLNRQKRFQNLAQAFAVDPRQKKRITHASVWLLDDIFTTGATAMAAAQVLRRQGISVAGICTVARTLSAAEIQSCNT